MTENSRRSFGAQLLELYDRRTTLICFSFFIFGSVIRAFKSIQWETANSRRSFGAQLPALSDRQTTLMCFSFFIFWSMIHAFIGIQWETANSRRHFERNHWYSMIGKRQWFASSPSFSDQQYATLWAFNERQWMVADYSEYNHWYSTIGKRQWFASSPSFSDQRYTTP